MCVCIAGQTTSNDDSQQMLKLGMQRGSKRKRKHSTKQDYGDFGDNGEASPAPRKRPRQLKLVKDGDSLGCRKRTARAARVSNLSSAAASSSSAPNQPLLQPVIQTKLWQHQAESVSMMRDRECEAADKRRNIGVLCLDLGSGKTLTAIALIANNRTVQPDYCDAIEDVTRLPRVLARQVQRFIAWTPDYIQELWHRYVAPLSPKDEPRSRLFYNSFDHGDLKSFGLGLGLGLDTNPNNSNDGKHDNKTAAAGARPAQPLALGLTTSGDVQVVASSSLASGSGGSDSHSHSHSSSSSSSSESHSSSEDDACAEDGKSAQQQQHHPRPFRIIASTLVVVPFQLFVQWKREIEERTAHLPCHFVHSVRDEISVRAFEQAQLVLCNGNKYNHVARFCNRERICWQRVVFDEAHAARIRGSEPISALFYWAVTTTYTSLHSIGSYGFLHNLYVRLTLADLKSICVRPNACVNPAPGAAAYRECYGALQPYNKYVVKCVMPPHALLISGLYAYSKLAILVSEQQESVARQYLRRMIRVPAAATPFPGDGGTEAALDAFSLLELKLASSSSSGVGSRHEIAAYQLLRCTVTMLGLCMRCLKQHHHRDLVVSACCLLPYCRACCVASAVASAVAPAVVAVAAAGVPAANVPPAAPPCHDEKSASAAVLGDDNAAPLAVVHNLVAPVCPRCRQADQRLYAECAGATADVDVSADDSCSVRLQKGQGAAELTAELKARYDKAREGRQSKNAKRRRELNETELQSHVSQCVLRPCPFIQDNTLNKMDACRAILEHGHRQSPSHRTLVFVNNTQTCRTLRGLCQTLRMSCSEAKFQASVIEKRLDLLGRRELEVLILNGRRVGTCNGLNIECADTIIVLSVASPQLLLQDIARAQRPGRTSTLNVYLLE